MWCMFLVDKSFSCCHLLDRSENILRVAMLNVLKSLLDLIHLDEWPQMSVMSTQKGLPKGNKLQMRIIKLNWHFRFQIKCYSQHHAVLVFLKLSRTLRQHKLPSYNVPTFSQLNMRYGPYHMACVANSEKLSNLLQTEFLYDSKKGTLGIITSIIRSMVHSIWNSEKTLKEWILTVLESTKQAHKSDVRESYFWHLVWNQS